MSAFQPGDILAERYRIDRQLFADELGTIYLAEQVRMGRRATIRVFDESRSHAIAGTRGDAASASRINHRGVATIYDFGETASGNPYIANEFVDGELLGEALAHEGTFNQPRAADITRQIAEALHAGHQLGVTYGKLTRASVKLFDDADGIERVKLLDFGVHPGRGIDEDVRALAALTTALLVGSQSPGARSLLRDLWPPRLRDTIDRAQSVDESGRYRRVIDFALDVATAVGATASTAQARRRPMTPLGVPGITDAVSGLQYGKQDGGNRMRLLAGGGVLLFAIALIAMFTRTSDTLPSATASSTSLPTPDSAPVPAVAAVPPAASVPDSSSLKSTPIAIPLAGTLDGSRSRRTVASIDSPRQLDRALGKRADSLASSAPPGLAPMANMMGRVGSRAGAHSWLLANGDSATSDVKGSSAAARESAEILGHLSRAERSFTANQMMRALPELRTGYEEYLFFNVDHPNSPESTSIARKFRELMERAQKTCAAMGDSAVAQRAPGLTCMMLERVAAMMPLP